MGAQAVIGPRSSIVGASVMQAVQKKDGWELECLSSFRDCQQTASLEVMKFLCRDGSTNSIEHSE